MKAPLVQLLIAGIASLLFSGCHTLDRYEWTGAQVLRGAGGMMKKDSGVEIWVQGEPSRDYVPIKIVETMTSGSIGVETYLFGVLKSETKKLGGDGFILLTKDARVAGFFSTGSSTTTGTVSLYGQTAAFTATTSSTDFAVPIQYNTYRALVFRYKE
jgi:hypothetical protein